MIAKKLIRILIDDYGMSKESIAGILGSSVRSVERWHAGRGTPLPVYRNRLQEMVDIEAAKGAKQ